MKIFGTFAVIIALAFGGLIYWIAEDTHNLANARGRADRICGKFGAVSYDVQDQDELVYACNSDHILRTMGY